MERIVPIQKHHRLNDVYAVGGIGPGGAHHTYAVTRASTPRETPPPTLLSIQFQKGPRGAADSLDGVLDVDLLEIVRDRLKAFQDGDMACRENALALTRIEEALLWMNERVEDRAARRVLGTMDE